MKIGLGIGGIVVVLVAVALLLFGLLNPLETLSLILFLTGAWVILFGAIFGQKRDRFYNGGWGTVIALLATFYFLPLQYTIGLVLLGIVVIILISVSQRSKPTGVS